MRPRTALAATALTLALAGVATAADPPAAGDRAGRFAMQPVEGGFARLDTATGDVSLCAKAEGTFECKPVKDNRDLQREIQRLAEENKELKAEIKRLDEMLGLNGERAKPAPKLELPSEEDVDKTLSYLERMFKKFRDKLKELDGGGKGTAL